MSAIVKFALYVFGIASALFAAGSWVVFFQSVDKGQPATVAALQIAFGSTLITCLSLGFGAIIATLEKIAAAMKAQK